jgi:adenine C2-methylase RlmN of 23S rRNA A2503 and tRNA A37
VQFSSYLDDKGLAEVEDPKFKSNPRSTLCISSQIGCAMGCTFCATGTMGLVGHLTAGEILEQLHHANQITPIQNVVFMGMGEPLDNYASLLSAIRGMVDVQVRFVSQSHIPSPFCQSRV